MKSKKTIKIIFKLLPFIILLLLPLIISQSKQIQSLIGRAFYQKADIIINSRLEIKNYTKGWLSFAQGGEEPGKNMIAPASAHLKNLSPNYIRIDHIFDDDYYALVRQTAQGIFYDFTLLDQTVDTIIKTGAKPMLVLSYMPLTISSSKTGVPHDWYQWQNLVQATIQHYSGVKSKNISDVYYEVWNEPDLESFGSFNYYGEKNYLTMYYWASLAAKNVVWSNPFKIGGPATTGYYPNWYKALLDFCTENNLPLGFISFHYYSFDQDALVPYLKELKELIHQYPAYTNTEIIVSEWGPDPEKNSFYNSNSAAAFIVHSASEIKSLADQVVSFEIKDGPDTNSWGIIGHENQNSWLKPRYSAYSWLSLMDINIDLKGNGTYARAIAGKKDKNIIVLVVNYDSLNRHSELVPIRIINLNPGKYILSKQILGEKAIYEEIELQSSVFFKEMPMLPSSVLKLELRPL